MNNHKYITCFLLKDVVDSMEDKGHETNMDYGTSVCQGVARQNGKIYANNDFRKDGAVDGMWTNS